jgi:hypothetical protein
MRHSSRKQIAYDKHVLYEQVAGVKGLVVVFSFIGFLLLLLLLRRMLLSTGFVFALWMS